MADSSRTETVKCPSCGRSSLDSEWCDHCGSNLSSAVVMQRKDWLDIGSEMKFNVDEIETQQISRSDTVLDMPAFDPATLAQYADDLGDDSAKNDGTSFERSTSSSAIKAVDENEIADSDFEDPLDALLSGGSGPQPAVAPAPSRPAPPPPPPGAGAKAPPPPPAGSKAPPPPPPKLASPTKPPGATQSRPSLPPVSRESAATKSRPSLQPVKPTPSPRPAIEPRVHKSSPSLEPAAKRLGIEPLPPSRKSSPQLQPVTPSAPTPPSPARPIDVAETATDDPSDDIVIVDDHDLSDGFAALADLVDGSDEIEVVDEETAAMPATPPGPKAPVDASRLQIQVTGIREQYASRRLWNATDITTGDAYILEERRLLHGEDEATATELEEIDEFADRYVYNPVSKRIHEGRLLTLFEAPRGESLEGWRRRVGREGATASAIMDMLRPMIRVVGEIHAAGRAHLGLNPRTVWVDGDHVGFTGIDTLETLPVERTRFRATVGFSAPELFGRSAQGVGAAADIYSLGAIAFYLVAGIIPPVAPETAFAPALAPRDFRPAFPVGWAEPILHATDPVPNQRQANPAALLAEFERGFDQMVSRSTRTKPVALFAEADRHIGFSKKTRSPINQDNVFLGYAPKHAQMLLAVADGVSTASFGSGDLASGFLRVRAEEKWKEIVGSAKPDPETIVREILVKANDDIVDYVNEHHGPLDAAPSEVMGSTALVAWVDDVTLTLGALGDSRCYVIRDDMMECVTRDHNLFTLSLIEGIKIDEVLMMPHGDALARCLGTFDVTRDGFLDSMEPPIDMYQFKLLPGDNILLCTDGLFDYSGSTYEESEANIRRRVLGEKHPGIACLELILLANRGGGGDNIGVGLVKVLERDRRK